MQAPLYALLCLLITYRRGRGVSLAPVPGLMPVDAVLALVGRAPQAKQNYMELISELQNLQEGAGRDTTSVLNCN